MVKDELSGQLSSIPRTFICLAQTPDLLSFLLQQEIPSVE